MDNHISWEKISESAENTLKDIPRRKLGPAGKILFDRQELSNVSTAEDGASGKREQQAERLPFPDSE